MARATPSTPPAPSPSGRGFVSVGVKLSLSTALLVLLVAAIVYMGLSRYERESLLARARTATC